VPLNKSHNNAVVNESHSMTGIKDTKLRNQTPIHSTTSHHNHHIQQQQQKQKGTKHLKNHSNDIMEEDKKATRMTSN
jgi:hypothetical protein